MLKRNVQTDTVNKADNNDTASMNLTARDFVSIYSFLIVFTIIIVHLVAISLIFINFRKSNKRGKNTSNIPKVKKRINKGKKVIKERQSKMPQIENSLKFPKKYQNLLKT